MLQGSVGLPEPTGYILCGVGSDHHVRHRVILVGSEVIRDHESPELLETIKPRSNVFQEQVTKAEKGLINLELGLPEFDSAWMRAPVTDFRAP